MNKKALVNEILDLYDTIDNLKNKVAQYEKPKQNHEDNNCIEETPKNIVIKELDGKAKQLLFKEVFNDYELSYTNIEVKEYGGEINFLTFEQWVKALDIKTVVRSGYKYLLDNLTFNEIKEYFRVELNNYFNQRVNDKKMEIVRSKKDENN